MVKEFEWMGIAYMIVMTYFFITGFFANNPAVLLLSLVCAIASGILFDGYKRSDFISKKSTVSGDAHG